MLSSSILEKHFDTAFDAPDGIKKLRELILTLAMQGKLVPQDPKDEPASELLKKIEAEKKRLVKEGKIKDKGSREDAKAQSVEGPYELPKGWVWTRLGEIGVWKSGSTPSRSNSQYYGGSIPWVKSGEVKQGRIKSTEEAITQQALNECSLSLNEKGCVLVAMYGANIGEVGILDIEATTNQAVCACRTYTDFDEQYLLLLITSLKPYFISQGAGAAQPNISREKIIATVFPLPPLAEQKRIVAKIDQLMARCDDLEKMREEHHAKRLAAHAAAIRDLIAPPLAPSRLSVQNKSSTFAFLSTHFSEFYSVRENVAELRKAILQLAVMGKLVPQDPKDQPASELLKEIQEEKLTRSREGAKGRKNTGSREDAKSQSVEGPYELPKGWVWTRLDEIVDISSGVTKGRNLSGKKIVVLPYLSVANVQRGYLLLDYVKEIEISVDEIGRFSLMNRDLLITEGGDWDKVGRTAIWNNQIQPCLHQNHVFRARIWLSSQNELWLENFLNSTPCREYFAGASKQTTNLASINKTQLMNCPIALPPLAEQKRIVTRIDQLMSLCDELEKQIDATTQKQTQLLSSLVSAV